MENFIVCAVCSEAYLGLCQTMFPFYTTWKHHKNRKFSGVFRGYKMGRVAWNGIKKFTDQKNQENSSICRRFSQKIASQGSFKYVWPFNGHQALKG